MVVVLDVKDLDVEVEIVTVCARCLLVVLLLDISSRGTASCSPSSRAAVATCDRGCCELSAILRLSRQIR